MPEFLQFVFPPIPSLCWSLDGNRLAYLHVLCLWQDTVIREVVTITRQSLSFLPVTYKSQHLYRELRMPWSCHELLKDLGYGNCLSPALHCSYEKSFCEKSDCLSPGKPVHGNNCSNCISNHKVLHLVHPISHSCWCLYFTRGFHQGKALLPCSDWGLRTKATCYNGDKDAPWTIQTHSAGNECQYMMWLVWHVRNLLWSLSYHT